MTTVRVPSVTKAQFEAHRAETNTRFTDLEARLNTRIGVIETDVLLLKGGNPTPDPDPTPEPDPVAQPYRLEAEDLVINGAAKYTDWPTASGGGYAALLKQNWGLGWTAPATLVTHNYKLRASVRQTYYLANAELSVYVNGAPIATTAITSTSYAFGEQDLAVVNLKAGDRLEILYTNELSAGSLPNDRNAYADYLLITPTSEAVSGTVPAPDPNQNTAGFAQTADPNALPEAKRLLGWLRALKTRTNNRVVVGQHINNLGAEARDGYTQYITALKTQSGKTPLLVGTGYTTPDLTQANDVLTQHWQAGGLVTVDVHWNNPFTGANSWMPAEGDPKPDLFALLTTAPASTAKANWLRMVDATAAGLKVLQSRGVVVIFRPLHEAGTPHFWWGCDISSGGAKRQYARDGYKALWRDLFNYLTNVHGLHNLLWSYATMPTWWDTAQDRYPGTEYVDIAGLDRYDTELEPVKAVDYPNLAALDEPLMFSEVGPQGASIGGNWDPRNILTAINTWYANFIGFLVWHSWSGTQCALIDLDNTAAVNSLMNDPRVITLETADWRTFAG